ncbi:hypothetical protein FB479_10591 [Brevibacillus sp. AG162]|nr:hypothetical protein FB479_10591 [Brevibacillus sp. AG162]
MKKGRPHDPGDLFVSTCIGFGDESGKESERRTFFEYLRTLET